MDKGQEGSADRRRTGLGAAHAALARSWFGLTSDEQRAVILVLLLFLLGLGVRAWHTRHPGPAAPAVPTLGVSP